MKNWSKILLACLCLLVLTGCADSVSFEQAATMQTVGFFHGYWHGIILPFSWLVSLFSESTAIYAIYNNGGWYDFGFVIGCGCFATGASSRRWRR